MEGCTWLVDELDENSKTDPVFIVTWSQISRPVFTRTREVEALITDDDDCLAYETCRVRDRISVSY